MDNAISHPFKVYFIANDTPDDCAGDLAGYCPWCEQMHSHGAGEDANNPALGWRVAHCGERTGSPWFGNCYELALAGQALSEQALIPTAPMLTKRKIAGRATHAVPQLHRQLASATTVIRRAILRSLLCSKRKFHQAYDRIGLKDGNEAALHGLGQRWQVSGPGNAPGLEGSGLPTLAATLYGLPPAIAFVRLVELATGLSFDGGTVQSLEQVFSDWLNAGQTQRRVRVA